MLNGKGRSGSDMRLKRVLCDEGDAPPFALDPAAEQGKARTEYSGGARSVILASSGSGFQRQKVMLSVAGDRGVTGGKQQFLLCVV